MMPRGELSLSLAGLEDKPAAPWAGGPRRAIEWSANTGYRWVQLDGRVLRARELSRSARRDLAALMRRLNVGLSGIDLWIRPEYLAKDTVSERAVEAVIGALSLAADLRGLIDRAQAVVAVSLPAEVDAALIEELGSAAERVGAVLADHAWPERKDGRIGVGVDPVAIAAAGDDVIRAVSGMAHIPAAARWSAAGSGGRVLPGSGSLDAVAYDAVLWTRGYTGPRVVDLRDVPEPAAMALDALARH
jgi:sugar phosphate isomerase/epimerase